MKLRIHGNSLRLRLSQPEVTAFWQTGRVEQALHFAPGCRLTYSLEADPAAGRPSAAYEDGRIRILLPVDQAREWVGSEETGISAVQPGDPGLSLLIEKDFRCVHRPAGEEHEDAGSFPNPLAAR